MAKFSKKSETEFKKACEITTTRFKELAEVGMWESFKGSMNEMYAFMRNQALRIRSEKRKKWFFVGTTAGACKLLYDKSKEIDDLKTENIKLRVENQLKEEN